MTAASTAILISLVAIVLLAPRRWALLGMMAGILYLTQGHYVQVAGLNIFPTRVLALAALTRVLCRRELSVLGLTRLDTVFFVLYGFVLVVYAIRTDVLEGYNLGLVIDAVVSYLAFRGLVHTFDEFHWFLRMTALILVPYAMLVCVETYTSVNPFAAVGGVELRRAGDLWFREGRLRATGSFGHPSLLGTCAATFAALYVGAVVSPKARWISTTGLAACVLIIWATNSGGPLTCLAVAAVGWALWSARREMRFVRRGIVLLFIALLVVMKAPIWYVLARISDVTGGDGFHRARLLDVAFQNLDKWWLAGMPLLKTRGWMPYVNATTGGTDITNHFLLFGLTAGLGALVLAVVVLIVSFSRLGKALAYARTLPRQRSRSVELTLWSLGVVLAIHSFNWFGISYWDQTNMLWLMHLAMVSSLTSPASLLPPQASPSPAAAKRTGFASPLTSPPAQRTWAPVHRRGR